MSELLDADTLVEDPAEAAVLVVMLTFERLDDPVTEGLIAGEPGLSTAAAQGAAAARNAELEINTEAHRSPYDGCALRAVELLLITYCGISFCEG